MNKAFALGLGIPVAIVALIVTATLFFTIDRTPQVEGTEQQRILDRVSEHFLIPLNSEPVVSRLTNTANLKEQQEFYIAAEDGDYLILLLNAKKAILYSDEKDLLLNVGPIVSE